VLGLAGGPADHIRDLARAARDEQSPEQQQNAASDEHENVALTTVDDGGSRGVPQPIITFA
jgi:hypothetical protein